VVQPLRRHLAPTPPDQRIDLRGEKPPGELGHHLSQQIIAVAVELLAQRSSASIVSLTTAFFLSSSSQGFQRG
jgi:hypothetical protein